MATIADEIGRQPSPLCFTQGRLLFDWYQDEIVVHYHHSNRVEQHRFETTGDGHHGGDKELAHDFLGYVTGWERSRTPLGTELLSIQLCLLARESCHTHAFQEVVLASDREAKGESASLANDAFDRDLSPHRFDQLAHDRQTRPIPPLARSRASSPR